MDLSKSDLEYTDLRGAELVETNLRGANLQHADLSVADDGTVTDLRGANLGVADDGTPTRLAHAKLRGADLSPSQGSVTNLAGADLSNADLGPSNNGTVANLTSADLSNANLIDTNLDSVTLLYTVLSGAKLTNKNEFQQELAEWKETYGPQSIAQVEPPPKPRLREAKGLTQEQLKQALGEETTELPTSLQRPEAWTKSIEYQKGSRK